MSRSLHSVSCSGSFNTVFISTKHHELNEKLSSLNVRYQHFALTHLCRMYISILINWTNLLLGNSRDVRCSFSFSFKFY